MTSVKNIELADNNQEKEEPLQNMLNALHKPSSLQTIIKRDQAKWHDQDFTVTSNKIFINCDKVWRKDNATHFWKKTLQYLKTHRCTKLEEIQLIIWIRSSNAFARALNSGICRNLTALRQLELTFQQSEKMTGTQIEDLVTNLARNLSSLQSLTLCFCLANQVTTNTLKVIGHEISQNLVSLTSLSLSFSHCSQLNECSFQAFGLAIRRKMTKLKRVCLSFGNCISVTDQGLEILGSSIIRYLPSLKSLALSFPYGINFRTDGVVALVSEVYKWQPNLRQLKLNFARLHTYQGIYLVLLNSCLNINDKAFEALVVRNDKPLVRLKTLTLELESWWILDKGLELLGQNLANSFPNIINFELSLKDCQEITDQGLIHLMAGIGKNLPQLRSFLLTLSLCYKLTNETLNAISLQVIDHMRDLKDLDLIFYGCQGITTEGVEKLANDFNVNQVKLRGLKLFYDQRENSKEHKEKLQEILSFIPNLQI